MLSVLYLSCLVPDLITMDKSGKGGVVRGERESSIRKCREKEERRRRDWGETEEESSGDGGGQEERRAEGEEREREGKKREEAIL